MVLMHRWCIDGARPDGGRRRQQRGGGPRHWGARFPEEERRDCGDDPHGVDHPPVRRQHPGQYLPRAGEGVLDGARPAGVWKQDLDPERRLPFRQHCVSLAVLCITTWSVGHGNMGKLQLLHDRFKLEPELRDAASPPHRLRQLGADQLQLRPREQVPRLLGGAGRAGRTDL